MLKILRNCAITSYQSKSRYILAISLTQFHESRAPTFARMADLNVIIPKLKLNDGNSMPMLAFGTGTSWYKSGEESKIDQAIIDAVKIAIKLGYNHLDGAESMF